MAVSNSIGSNTFDILVCLGLPWIIKAVMNGAESGAWYVIQGCQIFLGANYQNIPKRGKVHQMTFECTYEMAIKYNIWP
jgi:Ca2+/Na+ antiporter